MSFVSCLKSAAELGLARGMSSGIAPYAYGTGVFLKDARRTRLLNYASAWSVIAIKIIFVY